MCLSIAPLYETRGLRWGPHYSRYANRFPSEVSSGCRTTFQRALWILTQYPIENLKWNMTRRREDIPRLILACCHTPTENCDIEVFRPTGVMLDTFTYCRLTYDGMCNVQYIVQTTVRFWRDDQLNSCFAGHCRTSKTPTRLWISSDLERRTRRLCFAFLPRCFT